MRRAALVLGSVLLCALLLEGGARLALGWIEGDAPIRVGWERGEGRAATVRDLVYVPDPQLFFRLAPGLDVAATANPRIFDLRTNALGLRNDAIAPTPPPGALRVLAVGDSCTFGSGAGQRDTYPAQLETRLRERRPGTPVEVLNAGVPGFTSYQALRYLEIEGFELAPRAVVFASVVNDASPATAGPRRRFGASRQLSDREYAARLGGDRLAIVRLLERAGLGSGAGLTAPGEVKRRVPLADYRANLEAFAAQSRRRGILPVVVVWPLRAQVGPGDEGDAVVPVVERYQQAAAAAAAAGGAVLVDLRPVLDGRPERYVDAVHLDAGGYGLVAAKIAAELDRRLPGPALRSTADGAAHPERRTVPRGDRREDP